MNDEKPTITTTDSDEHFAGPISRRLARGLGWLAIALVGAFVLSQYAGMQEYWLRWGGACLKVATGGWGGFRIATDICRIDPAVAGSDVRTAALLHLARALIVSATILAVCLAV